MNDIPENLADRTIDEWIKLLRPGQLWAILVVLTAVLGGAFTIGYRTGNKPADQTAQANAEPQQIDAVDATKQGNPFQVTLRERGAIIAFEGFLSAAAHENWQDAWDLLGDEWRRLTREPQRLASEFRMTKETNCLYYIPVKITDLKEEYLVDFTFSDYLPALRVRQGVIQSSLEQVLKPSVLDSLVAEAISKLPDHFIPRPDQAIDIDSEIRTFLANESLRDLVLRDEVLDIIGQKLDLEPIVVAGPRGATAPEATVKRRLLRAIITRDNTKSPWKVQFFDSVTMEKH